MPLLSTTFHRLLASAPPLPEKSTRSPSEEALPLAMPGVNVSIGATQLSSPLVVQLVAAPAFVLRLFVLRLFGIAGTGMDFREKQVPLALNRLLIAVWNTDPTGILINNDTAHKPGNEKQNNDSKQNITRIRCYAVSRSYVSHDRREVDDECHE